MTQPPQKMTAQQQCRSAVSKNAGGTIELDRWMRPPPEPGPIWALQIRFITITIELNRYMMTVQNWNGSYELLAMGRSWGIGNDQFAGAQISSATRDGCGSGSGHGTRRRRCFKRLTDARDGLASRKLCESSFDSPNLMAKRRPPSEGHQ